MEVHKTSKMKQDNIIILGVVAGIFIVFSLFSLFLMVEIVQSKMFPVQSEVIKGSSVDLCSDLSLIETANCLKQEQALWWKYNISNTGKYLDKLYSREGEDINWTVIKSEGGVCSHSSIWYVDEAKKLGFYGKTISFFGNSSIGHEVALIYSKDLSSYCILDQLSQVKCQTLDIKEEVKNE